MTGEMTSMERVLTTLAHKEPDRVPLFLLLTLHGAKELNISIRDYLKKPGYLAKGQQVLQKKYHNDCYYTFHYAAVETEAWGGEVMFFDNGPPNAGKPFITASDQIDLLEAPDVDRSPCLQKVLRETRTLHEASSDTIPVIGVAISPFSLPIMQMGYEGYLTLLYEEPDLFRTLMSVNQKFCVEWANAQLDAGAHAICYFDPMASPTSISPELFRETGFPVMKDTISRIKGPTTVHMASGRCLPIADDLSRSGAGIVGVSALEDLRQLKNAFSGSLTILGSLNGITMRKWTAGEAELHVREAIEAAGAGGGFILSDNHGEIPFQVPETVLLSISDAVRKWGVYPLDHSKRTD